MDPLCLDGNKNYTEVKSAEGFLNSDVSGVEDDFGEPEVVPRVGDEFQAEIPPLVAAGYSEITANITDSFSIGLSFPVMWGHCTSESSCSNGTLESVTSEEGENVGGFSNFKSSYETDIDSCIELKTESHQPSGKYLLPGLLGDESWTDIEYNSFLLGLYVFGKNLNLAKKFVGTKSMGDILPFYYGKFYKSKGYSRWAECRKSKTRRCIFGQKIFTGWRQQELLTRLFPHVPPDRQTTLIEISRNFGEAKMPFEESVFALKDAVGIDLLIAAVGVGKGKYDLTGNAVEPTKTNHVFSARHEMPIGKACSTLTSEDIIKFLTGDFRLSKARSSDLFWEAVWPRLLANGWHSESEVPKDSVVSGSKQSLVFLIPGVKKFSRRRLVKGNHYFDSISDVLNKVASDPGILETEIQATVGSVVRENRQDKQNIDGLSNGQQCQSLQNHSSKMNRDLVKFTIVDTSMVNDKDQRKVRQTRSLPFQSMSMSTISSCSSESETATLEESEAQVEQASASSPVEDQAEQANSSYRVEDAVEHAKSYSHVEEVSDKEVRIHLSDCTPRISESLDTAKVEIENHKCRSDRHNDEQSKEMNNHVEEVSDKEVRIHSSDCTPQISESLYTTKVEIENHKCRSDWHNDEQSKEISEHPLIQKTTSDSTKMQELRACNEGEFSHSTENTSMDRLFDLNEPVLPQHLHEAYAPNTSNEGSVNESHQVGEVSAENSETRMLIDLNFPQVAPDLNFPQFPPMVIQQNDNHCAQTLSSSSEIPDLNAIQEYPDEAKEQQESINLNRRQSTRNRPLTTKALEALEYRFLNSKKKRKSTEYSDNNSKSQRFGASCCDNGIGNSISMADTREEEDNVMQAYNCSFNIYRGSP